MKTILVVDDASINRKLIHDIFGTSNYQIVEAANGQQALEMVLEYDPDLIILDILMPQLNGWQVAQTLKAQSNTGHIPIIGISSEGAADEERKAQEFGFSEMLTRPFNVHYLKNLVDTYLA